MSLINKKLVYEVSEDNGHSWQAVKYKEIEEEIGRSYLDTRLMLANLDNGLVVVTPFAKYRARSCGNPYLRRGKSSVYHKMSDDGKTSICGAASIDYGFEIVYREKILTSMTCGNCLLKRKVK